VRLDLVSKRLALAALVIVIGCGTGDPASPNGPPVTEAPPPEPPPDEPAIASPKANVRFLNASRLSKTFAKELGLPETEVCKELGQYQCVDFIHKISLLGTDPYLFGVNDPLPSTTTATPLVVERVATAGCITRVKIDRKEQASVTREEHRLFDRLVIDQSGKMDAASPIVAFTIDRLYTRALQRHATANEVADLRALYTSIEALPSVKTPAEDWAIASCVAVLTSMESLFY
jgi:hypothetical protein